VPALQCRRTQVLPSTLRCTHLSKIFLPRQCIRQPRVINLLIPFSQIPQPRDHTINQLLLRLLVYPTYTPSRHQTRYPTDVRALGILRQFRVESLILKINPNMLSVHKDAGVSYPALLEDQLLFPTVRMEVRGMQQYPRKTQMGNSLVQIATKLTCTQNT
jgi:hypothetical protein